MRFALFYVVIAFFVFWRMVLPLPLSRKAKAMLGGVIALSPLGAFYIATYGGGLASPELPQWFLVAHGFLSFTLLLLFGVGLIREVFVFLLVLAGRSGERTKTTLQRSKRLALGLTLVSGGLAALGLKEGIAVARVVKRDMPIANLSPELDGLTLVQLSDLHASALLREPHMAALVERVNALAPDIVVVTGDVTDGTVVNREQDVKPLTELKSRYGVYVCEGNHEHYSDYDHWCEKFPKMGWTFLKNTHATINVGKAKLVIAGVADPIAARYGRELPDVVAAFAGSDETAPRLLLAHQPKPAQDYRRQARFDVQLSGHTHGGQIRGMDRAIAKFNNGFVYGWYDLLEGAKLYVHSGSGLWNGFAVRLGVPSEIVLFTLRRA